MTIDDEDKTMMIGGSQDGANQQAGSTGSAAPKGKLVCLDDSMLDPSQKGLEIKLDGKEQTLGRARSNSAPILFNNVSSQHARIYPFQGKWAIEDLGSTNGTWIKGVRRKEAMLVPGEFIKIGAVPFQFVLDGPASAPLNAHSPSSASADDEDDDKTMFLGGAEAKTEKIVDSLADAQVAREQQEAVRQKQQQKQRRPAAAPSAAYPAPAEPAQKSGIGKIIVIILFLLALAGGGWYVFKMQGGPTGDAELREHKSAFKKFTANHEMSKKTLTVGDLQAQLGTLTPLLGSVSADAGKFPKNLKLKALQVRMQFMQMERQLLLSIFEKQMGAVKPLVNKTRALVASDWPQATDDQKNLVEGMRELLALADDVIQVKQLRFRYPEPSADTQQRPSPEEMASFDVISKKIVDQKKKPSINILLSVRYPLFGRIVIQVDEEDLPQFSRWKEY